MKKLLVIAAEFALFLLLNVIGGVFYHPFHVQTRLSGARSFAWDGVLFMLIAWMFFLLLSVARKKVAAGVPVTTVALALATLAGFLLKVGFVTHNW